MTYFIRFTHNPNADLERGYSFIGYQLEDTREEAFELLAENEGDLYRDDFDMATYMDENDDRIAQDNVTGMFGIRRSGLCGYGEYETVDEAIADSATLSEQYAGMKYMAIFEGSAVRSDMDGQDDGITFKPTAIVYVTESAR